MKVHYPKLYNMAHLLALNVLLLPEDLTIIFIFFFLDFFTSNNLYLKVLLIKAPILSFIG